MCVCVEGGNLTALEQCTHVARVSIVLYYACHDNIE